jgi:hypothetical protein
MWVAASSVLFLGAVKCRHYIALLGMQQDYGEWWNITGRGKNKCKIKIYNKTKAINHLNSCHVPEPSAHHTQTLVSDTNLPASPPDPVQSTALLFSLASHLNHPYQHNIPTSSGRATLLGLLDIENEGTMILPNTAT